MNFYFHFLIGIILPIYKGAFFHFLIRLSFHFLFFLFYLLVSILIFHSIFSVSIFHHFAYSLLSDFFRYSLPCFGIFLANFCLLYFLDQHFFHFTFSWANFIKFLFGGATVHILSHTREWFDCNSLYPTNAVKISKFVPSRDLISWNFKSTPLTLTEITSI